MSPYEAWKFIYPPRPEATASFGDSVMASWQKTSDAIGQLKINGTRNLVAVSPDREIKFWTRKRNKDLSLKYQVGDLPPEAPIEQKYVIPDVMKRNLLAMTPNGHWTVFDTELLHFKTQHVKNNLYFFDVLVWESQQLIGQSYAKRYEIIHRLLGDVYVPLVFGNTEEQRGAALGQNNFFIAQNLPHDRWNAMWNVIQPYEFVEGLVLKMMGGQSRLEAGYVIANNGSWMCKVRKPHKNYRK